VFVAAIALRPQLVGLGPLAPEIGAELNMEHAMVGVLTTIPLACMGLAAPAIGPVLARTGTSLAMLGALAVIAAGGILRSTAQDALSLVAWTLPIGIAIGLGGAALPVVVKERLPERPALATGVYTTAIQLGSTVSAALAVPLALALGGWREALVAFAVAGVGSVGAWLLLVRRGPSERDPEPDAEPARRGRVPWRHPIAWLVAMVFWLSAFPFYALTAWLASAYVELGWSSVDAGTLVALVGVSGLPASLAVGGLSDRVGSRRAWLAGSSVVVIVAAAGLIVAPDLAVLWAIAAGAALGATFTLAYLLPLDLGRTPSVAAGYVAVMLCVGYLLTSVTPWLLGLIRDATGSFGPALWLNVAVGVALLVVSLPFSRGRMDQWRDEGAVAVG
jgi:CP family cyanate transporter-like MFS transporter